MGAWDIILAPVRDYLIKDMNQNDKNNMRILLTGATGYVGGRLLKQLEAEGYNVRCFTRRASALIARASRRTEVIEGDILDEAAVGRALEGVCVAYYLVHSMGTSNQFEVQDRKAAELFASSAHAAGVGRIIYLGGLAAPEEELSPHLRSRLEVGKILRDSGIITIEFQASIIIGSGSLSFELIRNLVERLPVMLTPRWVQIAAQPVFIDDVLAYLINAINVPVKTSRIYEIGGADVTSYRGIMQEYARVRNLRRLMIPLPFLTPTLSSLWLNLITPVYARIGRKLIGSIKHPTVVRNRDALQDFNIRPIGIREAITRTLEGEELQWNQTRWSDSLSSVGEIKSYGGIRFRNRIIDRRTVRIDASADMAFRPIKKIGGPTGWYYANWLWKIRGWIDYFCGGVGLRRGKRDPDQIRTGDALDFWRVEEYDENRRLRLFAEMKLPGRAWLEFEIKPSDKETEIIQTAIFDPLGMLGLLYWYCLFPLHAIIFRGMLKQIARTAEIK